MSTLHTLQARNMSNDGLAEVTTLGLCSLFCRQNEDLLHNHNTIHFSNYHSCYHINLG